MLHSIPDASVDVVVTDPPAGIGFMGKGWDSFAGYEPVTERGKQAALYLGADPLVRRAAELLHGLALSSRTDGLPVQAEALDVALQLLELTRAAPLLPAWARGFVLFMIDVWTEVDRVLKPGGWICAWALPKTADLAGLAMRACGWATCSSREGWTIHDSLLHLFGSGFPKSHNVSKALDALAGAERAVVATMPDRWAGKGVSLQRATEQPGGDVDITVPATPEAQRWDGWGTALAPGHEQWLLARKPTPLTYAKQVLAHGCGAMNIDACRTAASEADRDAMRGRGQPSFDRGGSTYGMACGEGRNGDTFEPPPGGRWPANVLFTEGGDDCPVAELDRQSGSLRSSAGAVVRGDLQAATYGRFGGGMVQHLHGDEGGASRFFPRFRYQAKAHDRTAGLRTDTTNKHPTHKSVDLMRWLVRLLAAKAEHTGGEPAIVLDPFMGSGTTGVACVAERVRFIGIERDPVSASDHDSYGIAVARIMAAIGSPEVAADANAHAPTGAQLALL